METLSPDAQTLARQITPEEQGAAEEQVERLLDILDPDPSREGLEETPARVVRALLELTHGYHQDPKKILSKVFTADYDEMVVVRGIRFFSLCEHHLLPFTGTAAVGYIPDGKVVGLSKIPRLVNCYARRLQLQERMTDQIARSLMKHLGARGAGVILKAHHLCMGCRGVKQPDAEMITSTMLGLMREEPAARSELLHLFQ